MEASSERGCRVGVLAHHDGEMVGEYTHPTLAEENGGINPTLQAPLHQASRRAGFIPPSDSEPRPIVCCDPAGEIYPPALAAMGISPRLLYLLRPADAADQMWAVAECLRCKAVGAVIASPKRLSRTEARKLQLSAERGGGIGLLLRTFGQAPHYAAATRWLVGPIPGERTVQRWNIQLIHGPGGRVGQSICLELCRRTGEVSAVERKPIVETGRRIVRAS